ncbi:helix-turn-helix domain-containing protein [Photobacterium sp. TY1-4]|uniref:helix-turn-helix domain-containing protein n=1 Tax=Photobacterium sp. TY1-4 TaxID=2899122 RepID=UPI0021C1B2FF|nr:helix-turn-helix domain-containing protein [Photobacterium sp. TY1-4]UXI03205.1 helix-turn-helix domain-containing protein [Photobacterium sp. TY1-4]
MKTWKYPPANPVLAAMIDCYWLLERHHDGAAQPLLIPNPYCHLILTLPEDIHHYQIQKPAQGQVKGQHGMQISTVAGSHLLTPFTQALTIRDNPQVLRLGVKFQPGAQYRLLGLSGKENTNRIIPQSDSALLNSALNVLFQPVTLNGLFELRHQPESVVASLDRHFATILAQTPDDPHSRLTQQALVRLNLDTEALDTAALNIKAPGVKASYAEGSEGRTPNAQLPDTTPEQALGCSRRTLERVFVRVTGLTMKQYRMMKRLDALFLHLYQHPDRQPEWAEIAFRFGFSDQPHLIRQLKRAIGATPGSYLEARNLIIDLYGDFEGENM